MYGSPRQAYEQAARTSGQKVEVEALYRCARMLEACQQSWDAPDRARRLDEALRINSRLWTIFQADLSRADHPAPADLRANMLRLSAFVDRRTLEIRAAASPGKLQALIDLNRNIAAGLSTSPVLAN